MFPGLAPRGYILPPLRGSFILPLPGTPGRGLGRGGAATRDAIQPDGAGLRPSPSPPPSPPSTGEREHVSRQSRATPPCLGSLSPAYRGEGVGGYSGSLPVSMSSCDGMGFRLAVDVASAAA